MKLDMSAAWTDATELLKNNLGLITTVLGLFYFLPSFAIMLLFPGVLNPAPPPMAPGADLEAAFEAVSAAMQDQYANGWPFMLLVSIAQTIGAISVLALISERGSPTVGEALKVGLRGAPTYLAVTLLFALGAALVIGLLAGLAFALSPALGIILGLFLLIVAAYASIKLILVPAIIGMEGELNPIKVMKRSWALSKGNSLRIFVFLLVIIVTVSLVSLLAAGALTIGLAFVGEPIASIGMGFIESLLNAVVGGLVLVVVAAIYRQLLLPARRDDLDAFD